MKKIFLTIMILVMSLVMFAGCNKNDDVLRIHIRANSNLSADQEVKLCVRDKVVEYITPLIAECGSAEEVKSALMENLDNIKMVANNVLMENGFEYGASADINNEYFPSRDYGGVTFGADYYDALIIRLGSGNGDNWWCVAYPPLCFVGENTESNSVRYRSKLIELINKFWS